MTVPTPGRLAACLTFALTLAAGCATAPESIGPLRSETLVAVTDAAELIRFNAGQPQPLPSAGAAGTAGATGAALRIAGAAYPSNKQDGKLTTNFAIDIASGTLRVQGSREGVLPGVSPNIGELTAVGAVGNLGTGALEDAAFDIVDINHAALAALRSGGRTRLHAVDLATGRAARIGTVGEGRGLWDMAIMP